ncbi:MAG: hypothetical protein AAGM67_01110, partial [Bacteroidota bacterium]
MRKHIRISLGLFVAILGFLLSCQQSRGLKQGAQSKQPFDTTYQMLDVENIMVANAQYLEREDGLNFDKIINQIETHPDGYLLMTHAPQQTNPNVSDVFFLQTDQKGTIQSTQSYDDGFMEQFGGILHKRDGYFFATSTTFVQSRAHNDFNLVKISPDDQLLWAQAIEETGFQVPGALLVQQDAVYCFGRNVDHRYQVDLLLAKWKQDGSLSAYHKWGGPEHDFAHDIKALNDSTLLLLSIKHKDNKKWLTLTGMSTELEVRWTKKVVEVTGDSPT